MCNRKSHVRRLENHKNRKSKTKSETVRPTTPVMRIVEYRYGTELKAALRVLLDKCRRLMTLSTRSSVCCVFYRTKTRYKKKKGKKKKNVTIQLQLSKKLNGVSSNVISYLEVQ